jgi:hypothetical protein
VVVAACVRGRPREPNAAVVARATMSLSSQRCGSFDLRRYSFQTLFCFADSVQSRRCLALLLRARRCLGVLVLHVVLLVGLPTGLGSGLLISVDSKPCAADHASCMQHKALQLRFVWFALGGRGACIGCAPSRIKCGPWFGPLVFECGALVSCGLCLQDRAPLRRSCRTPRHAFWRFYLGLRLRLLSGGFS